MQYILLLRGINVGGKNKVSMAELKQQLQDLGYKEVISYINSGNILFHSSGKISAIKNGISDMLKDNYSFSIPFVLLNAEDYQKEARNLPPWWQENLARRDVLFYTDEVDRAYMVERIKAMELKNEIVHFGDIGLFWGKYDEGEYLKTAYHKLLAKEPYYKQITIRNGNTFQKILSLIDLTFLTNFT